MKMLLERLERPCAQRTQGGAVRKAGLPVVPPRHNLGSGRRAGWCRALIAARIGRTAMKMLLERLERPCAQRTQGGAVRKAGLPV
ncbi:hypothetical protein, partial [Aquitalea magnusonii]|uniref:hypothetical protein n=1 Tax=Aquitalea magnusonii TaxID=332411 RepID=UPI00195EC651